MQTFVGQTYVTSITVYWTPLPDIVLHQWSLLFETVMIRGILIRRLQPNASPLFCLAYQSLTMQVVLFSRLNGLIFVCN